MFGLDWNIKKFGKASFPRGINLYGLPRIERHTGGRGSSLSRDFMDDWIEIPGKGLAIYKTYDSPQHTKPRHKAIKNVRIYNELLCSKLADSVGIEHAIYECARYKKSDGLITYNILKENEDLLALIRNTSYVGDFVDYVRENEKVTNEDIRVMLKVLYSYMLFDIRTLQTDRNRNNAPIVKNKFTGELRVGELMDNEFAYMSYNLVGNTMGGDDYFGVFSRDGNIDVPFIISAYDRKMEHHRCYCLNIRKNFNHRSLEERIEEACVLAELSPDFKEILDNFLASFDLEGSIKKLSDEGVKISKHYLSYIRAIDSYVVDRFKYHREHSKEYSKKYVGTIPLEVKDLAVRREIQQMLDVVYTASKSVSDSVFDSYYMYKHCDRDPFNV